MDQSDPSSKPPDSGASSQAFGNTHIEMSEAIGRSVNNPLGTWAFDRLHAVKPIQPGDELLDIGAGRGFMATYAAKTFGVRVTAIEPSVAMATKAEARVRADSLSAQVRVINSRFESISSLSGDFAFVTAFDSLAWVADFDALCTKMDEVCSDSYLFCFSDYYSDDVSRPEVQELIKTWRLTLRGGFSWYLDELVKIGFRVRCHENTTNRYVAHWQEVLERIQAERPNLLARFGPKKADQFERSATSILDAVSGGLYGHFFAIVERRR